jgi:hypothetical protein
MPKKDKVYEGKIPFGTMPDFKYSDGTVREGYRLQLAYEGYQLEDWLDNKIFTSDLEFLSMSRGRSAANFEAVLRNIRGQEYNFISFLTGCHVNIFMTDMLDIIKKTDIRHGIIYDSLWTFCKRGSNYGLRGAANAS